MTPQAMADTPAAPGTMLTAAARATAASREPGVMVVPLVILALLSVVGGWVGVPGSLGGSNRFDEFLGPCFSQRSADPESSAMAKRRVRADTEGPNRRPEPH